MYFCKTGVPNFFRSSPSQGFNHIHSFLFNMHHIQITHRHTRLPQINVLQLKVIQQSSTSFTHHSNHFSHTHIYINRNEQIISSNHGNTGITICSLQKTWEDVKSTHIGLKIKRTMLALLKPSRANQLTVFAPTKTLVPFTYIVKRNFEGLQSNL